MGQRKRTIIPSSKRAITPRSYRSLWRVVDGAVRDCLNKHPEYLTDIGRRSMQLSMTKRVAGAVHGFASEAASKDAKRRSGSDDPAAKQEDALLMACSDGGQAHHLPADSGRVQSSAALARGLGMRPRAFLSPTKGNLT